MMIKYNERKLKLENSKKGDKPKRRAFIQSNKQDKNNGRCNY